MGRATIVSGGADGRYTINLDYGTAQRDAMVAKLTATINELETRKAWQQELVDGFQGGLESLQPEFDALVTEYVALSRANPQDRAAMDAKKAQLDKKTAEIIKQQAWLDSSKADLGMTEAGIKAATTERGAIQTAEVSEQRQAWCADLTESATGAVATLEVPGESALILIQPGAPAPTAIHGALTARDVMSPAQAYWNAAVLPGWQKFKPTYRWGTITALDQNADKCTVELAEAKSSAKRLDVNQADTLKNVPIVYMECNSAVFTVGDRVIVGFTDNDWTKPKVVGFVDHPKPCAWVLSGVVKTGDVIDLPIPDGSPTGTIAKKALRWHRPTKNAWETVLSSDPTKGPGIFADESRLGNAGSQYRNIFPSQFSGAMAKAVQIIMGRGKPVVYKSGWSECHGIILEGPTPWLVEISAARGILAMRLPVTRASSTSSTDAVAQAVAMFGGVPSGATFPTDLEAALNAGIVRRLMTTEAFSEVSSKMPYSLHMGWSFNADGSEAHNTCWYTKENGHVMGCHFKLSLSSSSASLTLVSEGRLVHRLTTLYGEFEENPLLGEEIVAFSFGGGGVGLPRQTVSGLDVTEDINTTVFVCHIGSDLHKVDVQWHAYSAARDAFIRPQISTAFSDKLTMLTGWENCYDTIATAGTNYVTASAYGVCSPLVRDGYAIHEQARPVFNNPDNSYSFIAARTHVALPAGVFVTDRDDTTAALVFGGYRLLADVDRQFDPLCSMYGATDHYFYVLSVDTDQFIDGIGESAIAGDGLVGESLPPASAYNFIGYL